MSNRENQKSQLNQLDYLVVGHITEDITPSGKVLGGTVTYSALTARAMGLKVGILTSCSPSLDISPLAGVEIIVQPSEQTTTFENISQGNRRTQYLYHLADPIDTGNMPDTWKSAKLVHLGPVVNEINAGIIGSFPNSVIGLTPQGLLRGWDKDQQVFYRRSPDLDKIIDCSRIVILSIEDVYGDETVIKAMAKSIPILVVTEGAQGSRVYWNGEMQKFPSLPKKAVDTTGAGDIFAAAFMARYIQTQNPWEAGPFASIIAAESVTRPGISGVPTPQEAIEVLENHLNQKKG